MTATSPQENRMVERVDNGLKIIVIIFATVFLTSVAVYFSFSFVEQVKRNQLNQAAQHYAYKLNQKISALEEQLQLSASSSQDKSISQFKAHAKRVMEKNSSITLVEIRDDSAR